MPASPPSSRNLAGVELAYTEFTADVAVTQTVEASATVVVTAPAVVFDGATIALIQFFSQSVRTEAVAAGQVVLNLWQDGADIGRLAQVATPAAATTGAQVHAIRRMTPAAGSRTYSIRCWITAAGTATVQAGAGGAGVSMPGFLRITRAA